MVTWVFFRAVSLQGAITILAAMASPSLDASGVETRFLLLAAGAAVISFTLPNTQEIFARYRVSIRPEWAPPLALPRLSWRLNYASLFVIAVLAGVATMYEADFPQFLYWGF
jgi:hypothetical protein